MDQRTFHTFCQIVYDRSGINLGEHKAALVAARVGKRMRELGIEKHRQYLERVMADETGEEIVHLLDVISTNVTSFFREEKHFAVVGDIFRRWYDAGQRTFRFWCCACSSGEEPYSLAMTLLDRLGGAEADIKILATDISTKVLRKCRAGVYPEQRMAGVPLYLRERYFDMVAPENARHHAYRVKPVLANMVRVARLNLSRPPFPMSGPFDAVFCRNVMIYFDNAVRTALLREIDRLLRPDGVLFVGHAESLTGMVSDFKSESPSVYVKKLAFGGAGRVESGRRQGRVMADAGAVVEAGGAAQSGQ